MAPRIPTLTRPIVRRVGRLVVKITPAGIELRGYRKQSGARCVSWAQVASLATSDEPALVEAEAKTGLLQLVAMAALPLAASVTPTTTKKE